MKSISSFCFLFLIVILMSACSENQQTITVGFYNLENLFDTINDPNTNDEWFLPTSDIQWNSDKYTTKLHNLAEVISEMADGSEPDLLGVCEVENKAVVEDLIDEAAIRKIGYSIAHVESKDERGIDVALLYKPSVFSVTNVEAITVDLSAFNDKTRDILRVDGTLSGTPVSVYVNHWPSRSEGMKESEPKRIRAATTLYENATQNSRPAIIIGDFNDEPYNRSIQNRLFADDRTDLDAFPFYNCMFPLEMKHDTMGTYCYRGDWNMLDQVILSDTLLSHPDLKYVKESASIYNPGKIRQHTDNEYDGYPNRTFGGRKYLGGYSDHFPVYIKLVTTKN